MTHQFLGIDPGGAKHEHETRGILMIRLVAQVFDHWQFLGTHLSRNLLQDLATRNLVRKTRDNDVTAVEFIGCTNA